MTRTMFILIAVLVVLMSLSGYLLYVIGNKKASMDMATDAVRGVAAAASSASSGAASRALAMYPTVGKNGMPGPLMPKADIGTFLRTVNAKMQSGMAPADAWNSSKQLMYVLDGRVEQLENAMISDNALQCTDNSEIGGSAIYCKTLLNRNVPGVVGRYMTEGSCNPSLMP